MLIKDAINLLPRELQLKRAHRAYLVSLSRLMKRVYLPLLLVVGILALVLGAVITIRNQLVSQRSDRVSVDVSQKVTEVNDVLVAFEKRLDEATIWTSHLEDVLAGAPDGIKITKLKGDGAEGLLVIEGEASSSSEVVDFQQELEELSWVATVDAPLQNFALGAKSEFSFSLFFKE